MLLAGSHQAHRHGNVYSGVSGSPYASLAAPETPQKPEEEQFGSPGLGGGFPKMLSRPATTQKLDSAPANRFRFGRT